LRKRAVLQQTSRRPLFGDSRGCKKYYIIHSIGDTFMGLSRLQEIERAIDALTQEELGELYSWLDERHPLPIDARVESDLAAGRLDKAIRRALADEKNGHVPPI